MKKHTMKKTLMTLSAFLVIAIAFSITRLTSFAAVAPAVPTGLGFYGQNNTEFGFSWALDSNIVMYGADYNFGYELVVMNTKGKVIGTYDKNSINNGYDTNFRTANNKIYMAITNKKLTKQPFKFKVRAYVYDEAGNKLYSDYSSDKVVVPRARIKKFKASSRSSGKITWQKIKGAKSYSVYVASSETGKYKKKGTTSSTSYTVKNMSLGKRYYVYVVANGVKIKKKKYNSAKTELKQSGASSITIYLTY